MGKVGGKRETCPSPKLSEKKKKKKKPNDQILKAQLTEGNCYKTRQRSFLYVIVLFFGLDPSKNTMIAYSKVRN